MLNSANIYKIILYVKEHLLTLLPHRGWSRTAGRLSSVFCSKKLSIWPTQKSAITLEWFINYMSMIYVLTLGVTYGIVNFKTLIS